MKLKLIGAGYDKFDGVMGDVYFKDGVSVDHVTAAQARLISAIMPTEDVDTSEDPSENAQFQRSRNMQAELIYFPSKAELSAKEDEGEQSGDEVEPTYTREALEEIADKGGIKALREIGDKLGVKSTSIPKLIDAVIEVQSVTPPVGFLPEGQPDVDVGDEG